jgi:hypothetical protein
MDISLCRNTASGCGIEKISQSGNIITFYTKDCDAVKWTMLVNTPGLKGIMTFSTKGKQYFSYRLRPGENPVEKVGEVLRNYSSILTAPTINDNG